MDEFEKMKMEDERNQERRASNAPSFEEKSLNESLGNIEEFLNCEEPEDPEEREKRRQEAFLIKEDMNVLEGMFTDFQKYGGIGDELKNLEVGPSSLPDREDLFEIKSRPEMSIEKQARIIKIKSLKKKLESKHFKDADPSTEQEIDLGIRPHSRFVNTELQAKMDEFEKMKMEDERNQERRASNAPSFEEKSLNESLGNIEEFLNCEEPEDPEEREKRRQEGVLIEKDVKLIEGFVDSSFGVKRFVGASSLHDMVDFNATPAGSTPAGSRGRGRGRGRFKGFRRSGGK